MKKLLSILFITTMITTVAFATDNLDNLFDDSSLFGDTLSNETNDDLFGGDNLFSGNDLFSTDSSTDTLETSLFEDLLTSETEISGSYSFKFNTGITFDLDNSQDPHNFYSTSDISSNIQLSARPSTDTRFYTDMTISYPFENEETTTYLIEVADEDSNEISTGTIGIVDTKNNINIDELFYDFVIDDYFIRVGKQTLNMGVGYFYSPANLLNISSINPLDPEADQEGPVAVKVNKPIENDNLYAYVLLPNELNYTPADISVAVRYETLIGDAEYSLSGYYAPNMDNDPTKLALTVSTPIYTDIDLVAEAVESYNGTDFNFEGTVGLSVMKDLASLSDTSITFIGQYYYNQDGGMLDTTHQLGAMLSLSTSSDISFSLSSINSLDKSTGFLTSNLCYDVSDDFAIDFGASYIYGIQNTIQPYVGFTLGQGDF